MSNTNTDKQREEGYYWVVLYGVDVIMEWRDVWSKDDDVSCKVWVAMGNTEIYQDSELDEIGERILPPNETKTVK